MAKALKISPGMERIMIYRLASLVIQFLEMAIV